MDKIIHFFIEPYLHAGAVQIILEITAAALGILSVFYAKKENILVYPTGIISTGIYVYLLAQWQMYGDLIINIYYTIMSIYGWYMWSKLVDGEHHIPITRSTLKDKLLAAGIFLFTAALVIFVYRYDWHGNGQPVIPERSLGDTWNFIIDKITSGKLSEFRKTTPYFDTFTTGAAFSAMWLMANKKLENWTFWIAVNIVSVPMYFVKGFGFTGIQYFIFLILAFQGYQEWKKNLNNSPSTS